MSESVMDQLPGKMHHTNRLAEKLKLRKAYVRGEGSLEALCAKQHISYQTAHVWSTAEKWPKLKMAYDKQELLKLIGAVENEQPRNNGGTITERQLEMVNYSILACDDANEIAKLTRAKLDLQEALWIERNGFKPGTQRPSRRGNNRAAIPTPEPQPDTSSTPEPPPSDPPLSVT